VREATSIGTRAVDRLTGATYNGGEIDESVRLEFSEDSENLDDFVEDGFE